MDFNEQMHLVQELISQGNTQVARTTVANLKIDSPHKALNVAALFIDIGSADYDTKMLSDGIRLIESNLKFVQAEDNKSLLAVTYYNLGNGFYGLFQCKKLSDYYYACFNKTELQKTREYYLNSIYCNHPDLDLRAKTWTNLGNCYRDMGRVIESLDCYENALSEQPDFSEAMANKGESLIYYARLSPEHKAHFIIDGYQMMIKSLTGNMDPSMIKSFKNRVDGIRDRIIDKTILDKEFVSPGIKIDANSDFEQYLVEFCLEHNLYLNICTYCNKCNAAIGDPVAIKHMIVLKGDRTGPDFRNDPYVILAGFLNHIKQDYITARFLLCQSMYTRLDLSFVDKNVRIIDTLQYSIHNIYNDLAKASFTLGYNIIDKIAQFLNQYMKLRIDVKKVYFSNIWYTKDFNNRVIKPEFGKTNSFPLNAIFEIHREIIDGDKRHLLDTRHSLVHRFLDVNMFEISDQDSLTEEQLKTRCIELLQVVRNLIIYLLFFVDEQEGKKNIPDDKLGQMFAMDLPDHLKSVRHVHLEKPDFNE